MQAHFYNNAGDFTRKAGDFLSQYPAEHNLILSICETPPDGTRFFVLENDEGLVMAAVASPGRNLVMSRVLHGDAGALAALLHEKGESFPGLVGPSDAVAAFSAQWSALTGQAFGEYMDQIVYALTKVEMPEMPEGRFRPATAEDAPVIAAWMQDFSREVLPKAEYLTAETALPFVQKRIAAGTIAVWDVGGKPVAQAAVTLTTDVARINAVYTPVEHRGYGYASAVVAMLTQAQLDAGRRLCCLYADARNPVSNSIYRKIGYAFVGRSSLYTLK